MRTFDSYLFVFMIHSRWFFIVARIICWKIVIISTLFFGRVFWVGNEYYYMQCIMALSDSSRICVIGSAFTTLTPSLEYLRRLYFAKYIQSIPVPTNSGYAWRVESVELISSCYSRNTYHFELIILVRITFIFILYFRGNALALCNSWCQLNYIAVFQMQ